MALIRSVRFVQSVETKLGSRRASSNHYDSIEDKCLIHLFLAKGFVVLMDREGIPRKAMPLSSVLSWEPFVSDKEGGSADDFATGSRLPKKLLEESLSLLDPKEEATATA